MNFQRNCIYILILTLLLLLPSPLWGADSNADELTMLKKRTEAIKNTKERMDSAMVWKNRYGNDEKELYLLHVILDCAKKTNDKEQQAFALRNICRCSYNIFDPDDDGAITYYDSVFYYCKELERMALNTEIYYNYLCDAKSFVCYTNINKGKFSEVLEITAEMLSDKKAGRYSEITAYELMGQTYASMLQDSLSAIYYEKAYNLSKKDETNKVYNMYLCLLMCNTYLTTNSELDLLPYLKELEDLIKDVEQESQEYYLTERNYALLYSYYLSYYLKSNDMEKARYYAEKAAKYKFDNDSYAEQVVATLQSQFEMRAGNLSKALEWISKYKGNQINYVFYLEQKVEVLSKLGRYEEALECEREYQGMQQRKFNILYTGQLAEIEAKHNTYVLEQQKASRETTIFVLIIVFTFLTIAILIVMNRRILKAKKKLEYSKKRVEMANATQKTFLQNMSHEIRTPLNAICGFSQLLTTPEMREFISDEEMKQYGNIIRSNTDMLTTLVNDILDISDMNSGKYRMNFEDISANSICQNAINTVSYRCPEHIKLYMTSTVDDDFTIFTDAQRAAQILINFLTNAIKHTSQGEIHVHCSLEETPGMLTFSVTDTGEGVPADKANLIFGRFEKLDTFKQGTGLGLAICRTLARLMKGSVKLDTSYTNGARFVFIHPLKSNDATSEVSEDFDKINLDKT